MPQETDASKRPNFVNPESQQQKPVDNEDQRPPVINQEQVPNEVPREEQKNDANLFVPLYYGVPVRTFMGSLFGYCVGAFIRKFSKKIASYAGGAFVFLGILAYNDWISINWKKIDKDLINLVFRGTR